MLPNVPYFPVIYYGILRAGGVVVPMNVLLKEREVRFYLDDSGAKLLFAWHGFAEAAEAGAADAGTACLLVRPGEFEQLLASQDPVHAMAERGGGDTAVVLYTSGTLGTPKGAELTHANLRRNCTIVTQKLGGFSEEDVLIGSPAAGARARPCRRSSWGALAKLLDVDPDEWRGQLRACGSTSPRLATSCPTSSRPSWTHGGVGSTRPAETTSARGRRA